MSYLEAVIAVKVYVVCGKVSLRQCSVYQVELSEHVDDDSHNQ